MPKWWRKTFILENSNIKLFLNPGGVNDEIEENKHRI